MENSSEHTLSSQEQNLSRRELLKVLAAGGGGLAAAAFLPGRWLKPVVEAGVLPAHAQATNTLKIVSLSVWSNANPRSQPSGVCETNPFSGSASYVDDLCRVGVDSTYLSGSASPYGLSDWDPSGPLGGSCSGYFNFNFSACCNQVFSAYLQVGARQSAPASANLPPCTS